MNRFRRFLLVLLACGIVAVLAILLWPREKEPVYQGKKLSRWLELYNGGAIDADHTQTQIRECREALRTIGSNAVPSLLTWVEYRTPGWRRRVAEIAYHLPGKPVLDDRKAERAAAAWLVFPILGPQARTAVPGLIRLLNDPNTEFDYRQPMYALGDIGEDALPALLAMLKDQQRPDRGIAALIIGATEGLGTNRVKAVPTLIQCLKDKDEMLAADAARALGRLGMEAKLVVPALTNCLSDGRAVVRACAVESLARFKDEARPAVPVLLAALGDQDPRLRSDATNALMAIAPEVLQTNAAMQTGR